MNQPAEFGLHMVLLKQILERGLVGQIETRTAALPRAACR